MSKKSKWIHLGNSFSSLRDIVLSSGHDEKNIANNNKNPGATIKRHQSSLHADTRVEGSKPNKTLKNRPPTLHHQEKGKTECSDPLGAGGTETKTPAKPEAAEAECLKVEVSEYKKKILTLSAALEESRQEVECYREKYRKISNELKRNRIVSNRLFNELKEARAHIEYLSKKTEYTQEKEELKRKCAMLEEENQRLERELSSSNTKLEGARKRIRKLSKERKTLAVERDELESELRDVEKELRVVATEKHNLERNLISYYMLNLFDLKTLCFIVAGWDYTKIFSGDVVRVYGEGPLSKTELKELFQTIGLKTTERIVDTEILVLGRESLDESEIEYLLETWINKNIFIYSQELLIFTLISGKNPFHTMNESELRRFANGHPGLEYLLTLGFEWPFSEYIPDEPNYIGTKNYLEIEESPLKRMGYTVGITHGLSKAERRKILKRAYLEDIPSVGDEKYMEEWSKPRRVKRLWRIAHHLHWLCNSRKNNPNMCYAIKDWSSDLDWLKKTYYRPWMRFRWPDTHID